MSCDGTNSSRECAEPSLISYGGSHGETVACRSCAVAHLQYFTPKSHTQCAFFRGSSHSLEDLKTRPSRKIHSLCSPRVSLGFDTCLNGLRKNKQGVTDRGIGFHIRQETAVVPTCLLRFYCRFLRSTQGSALTTANRARSQNKLIKWLCTLCVATRMKDFKQLFLAILS